MEKENHSDEVFIQLGLFNGRGVARRLTNYLLDSKRAKSVHVATLLESIADPDKTAELIYGRTGLLYSYAPVAITPDMHPDKLIVVSSPESAHIKVTRALGAAAVLGTDYLSNWATMNGERTNSILASTTREVINLKNMSANLKLARAVLGFSMVEWADAMLKSNEHLEQMLVVVADKDKITSHSPEYGATIRGHKMSFVEVEGRHDTLLTHPQRLFEQIDRQLQLEDVV